MIFVLQIEKKPSRRSPTKKKNTGFRLPAPVYVGIRCFFFVGDLLDDFFSICNTKKKQKKGVSLL